MLKNTDKKDIMKDEVGEQALSERGWDKKKKQVALLADDQIKCHQLNQICITTLGNTSHNKDGAKSKPKEQASTIKKPTTFQDFGT